MVSKCKLRQYFATFTCTLCVTMTGVCFVWLTPIMLRLMEEGSEIPVTPTEMSWIVASIEFGELLSPIPPGILVNRWGRKRVLLVSGPLCIASWIVVLTTRSVWALFAVRVVQGVAVGIVYTVGPMYIAEISEPSIRGQLSGHFQTMWYVGVMFAYCVGPRLSYRDYAYACAVWPFLFVAGFSLVPESPYFLLMVEKHEEAEKALCWLRGTEDVEKELKAMRGSVEEDAEGRGRWGDLVRTERDRKALFVVQAVCFVKYMNGMPAVVSYATATFAQSSGGFLTDDQLTVAMGGVLLVTTFFATYVVDSVGRRPLLLLSTAGSLVFNTLVGLYYYLEKNAGFDVSGYVWTLLMYLSVAGYCVVCSLGLGPVLQTVQAEFFPSNTRGLGGAVTGIISTLTTFINLKQYQIVEDNFGVYTKFWIFAFFALLGTVVLFRILPETAGKSLGQIQTDLKRDTEKPDDSDLQSTERFPDLVEHL